MIARGWALPLALVVLAASACGSDYEDDHDRLLATWERDDQGFPPADFEVSAGESHCDVDSVLFLGLRWPLDSGDPQATGLVFVRDPDGVLAEETVGSYVPEAALPDDAIPTGYENYHGVEVWLTDDLSAAYAVDGNAVEAWPAFPGSALCA